MISKCLQNWDWRSHSHNRLEQFSKQNTTFRFSFQILSANDWTVFYKTFENMKMRLFWKNKQNTMLNITFSLIIHFMFAHNILMPKWLRKQQWGNGTPAQSTYLALLTIFWRFLNFSHRLMPKWLREIMRKRYTTQYRLQPSQLIWDCPKWKPTTPSTSGCNLGLLSKTAFFSSTLERPQILSH